MKRGHWLLVGLLAVQVVLIVLTRGPLAHSEGPGAPTALLASLESSTPAKIEIEGPKDERVTLVRDGGHWMIQEADGFPADDQKVDGLIEKLKAVKVTRPIVTSGRYHEALKVTEKTHERRVRIWNQASGNASTGLYLGSSPNYRVTHVRKEGDDRVYEVSDLGAFDVQDQPSGWVRSQLVDLQPQNVTTITVENTSGRFEITKGEDGAWSVASPAAGHGALDASKVTELLRAATSVRVAEPAGSIDRDAQGFSHPAARIKLVPGATASGVAAGDADSRAVLLEIGGKVTGEEGKRYVTVTGLDHAGIVYASSVDKLIEQKLSDLR